MAWLYHFNQIVTHGMEGLSPKEKAVFITRMRKERISNRRVEQLISGAMKAAGLI